MVVDLGKYVIMGDSHSYHLKRKFTLQDGTVEYKAFRYYTSLPLLLRSLINMEIRESDVTTLKEMQNEMNNIYKLIEEKFSAVE